jgi:sRNA-binding regulator protein Hfq
MNQANVTHLNRDVRFAAPAQDLGGNPSYGPERAAGPRPYTPRPFNQNQNEGGPRKFVAKGHDAQLQEAQYGNLATTLTTMNGNTFAGTVVKRDKYTITLRHSTGDAAGQDEIFYKHAIEGILIARPARPAYTN